MNTTLATWEDEDNNRLIHFSVTYVNENGNIEIQSVTPEKISFVCQETNTHHRSIGVWTETGRQMIARKLHDANVVDQLKTSIAAQNKNVSAPHIKIAASCQAASI